MAENWKGTSQDYGKVNFDFVLMTHIQDISKQLSRLPHESIIANMNEPVGTTHADIINSYCDMVQHLEELLKPYWDEEYKKEKFEEKIKFVDAKRMFGCLMQLCSRNNFLFTKIRVKVSGEDSEKPVD